MMLWALLGGVLHAAPASEAELLKIATDARVGVVERTKAFADLRAVASDRSIPALVGLLGDPKLGFSARSVLEALPGQGADRALLAALQSATEAGMRTGLVNSLGNRRTAEAVPAIAGFLRAPDPSLAGAALNALGNIGTAAAADALAAYQPTPGVISTWGDAVLRTAQALQNTDRRRALALYRVVSTQADPVQRAAATMTLARLSDRPVVAVAASLSSADGAIRSAALAVIRGGELGPPLVEEVGRMFPSLPPEVQVQLLSTLYDRGDRTAASIARQALKAAEPGVRAAAARLLSGIGSAQDASALLELMNGGDEPGRAARLALARIPGEDVTLGLVQRFRQDSAARPAALEVMVARGHRPLMADLLDPALHTDETLRPLAANAIGTLGTGEDLEGVLTLHRTLPVENRGALEGALRRIATKHPSPDEAVALIANAAQRLPPAETAPLYTALAAVGGDRAREVLVTATGATEPELRRAALAALGSWRDIRVTDTLFSAARGDAEPANRALALRSATAVLARSVDPDNAAPARAALPAAIAGLREAWEMAERVSEKNAVVAALRRMRDPSARATADELENRQRNAP